MTFELEMGMYCLTPIAGECSVSASIGDLVMGDDVIKPTERA
jgi:hypothetical protein